MSKIVSRDLGFAAYVMMQKGVRLVDFDRLKREFVLESEEELEGAVLRGEYINSCCRTHDSNVLQLKQLISGG